MSEHPGVTIRGMLDRDGIKIAPLARDLGVARWTLIKVLDGQSALSAEMALRLERVMGMSAEALMCEQARHDLERVRTTLAPVLATMTPRNPPV